MTTAFLPTGVRPEFTLADRLRKAREFAGFDQRELAARICVSRTAIVNAENGHSTPRAITLAAWAEATGVALAWLQGGDDYADERGLSPAFSQKLAVVAAAGNADHPGHADALDVMDIITARERRAARAGRWDGAREGGGLEHPELREWAGQWMPDTDWTSPETAMALVAGTGASVRLKGLEPPTFCSVVSLADRRAA